MLNILEAYDKTLAAAKELEKEGVTVKITPSNSTREVKSTDQLPREKWVNIGFHFENEEQAKLIREKSTEVGKLGIVFDEGGTKGQRDWEIDWSFKVREGLDKGREAAKGVMEEIIEKQ
jgi:hypothetical protein